MALTTFAWNAIAGGVAYDGIKQMLGNLLFERLAGYAKNGQQKQFEAALQAVLESNNALRENLAKLAAGITITDNISTGKIVSGGNVIVGNGNRMG